VNVKPEHWDTVNTTVSRVAGRLHKQNPWVEESELYNEGLSHAIPAYGRYWVTVPKPSVKGLGGWLNRCTYLPLAMYVWRLRTPYCFPNRTLPPQVRHGFERVAEFPHKPPGMDHDVEQKELRDKVAQAMGYALSVHPLARIPLTQGVDACQAHRLLQDSNQTSVVNSRKIRRETARARALMERILRRTLKEHTDDQRTHP